MKRLSPIIVRYEWLDVDESAIINRWVPAPRRQPPLAIEIVEFWRQKPTYCMANTHATQFPYVGCHINSRPHADALVRTAFCEGQSKAASSYIPGTYGCMWAEGLQHRKRGKRDVNVQQILWTKASRTIQRRTYSMYNSKIRHVCR